jgi:hypothetical protein
MTRVDLLHNSSSVENVVFTITVQFQRETWSTVIHEFKDSSNAKSATFVNDGSLL